MPLRTCCSNSYCRPSPEIALILLADISVAWHAAFLTVKQIADPSDPSKKVGPALAGTNASRVAAFDASFTATAPPAATAGRRRLARAPCTSLPITLTSYSDYSCADYAAVITKNGGTPAAAANCTGGMRRVQQAAAALSVPLSSAAVSLANAAAFHDFTSLVRRRCYNYFGMSKL